MWERKKTMIKIHNYRRNMDKINNRAYLFANDLIYQDTRFIEKHDWENWGKIRENFLKKFRKTYGRYYRKKLTDKNGDTKLIIDHFFLFNIYSCEKCNRLKGHNVVTLDKFFYVPKNFINRLKRSIKQELGVDYASERSM